VRGFNHRFVLLHVAFISPDLVVHVVKGKYEYNKYIAQHAKYHNSQSYNYIVHTVFLAASHAEVKRVDKPNCIY
jgi:hypothetical protein